MHAHKQPPPVLYHAALVLTQLLACFGIVYLRIAMERADDTYDAVAFIFWRFAGATLLLTVATAASAVRSACRLGSLHPPPLPGAVPHSMAQQEGYVQLSEPTEVSETEVVVERLHAPGGGHLHAPAVSSAWRVPWPSRAEARTLAVLGAFIVCNQLFANLGVQLAGALLATCMQPFSPVMAAGLATAVGQERLTLPIVLGFASAVGGAVAVAAGRARSGGGGGGGGGGGDVGGEGDAAGVGGMGGEGALVVGMLCLLLHNAGWAAYVTSYVESKAAQPSASWLSGGLSQRQSTPRACPKLLPSSGQARPTRRLGRAGLAGHPGPVFHTGHHARRGQGSSRQVWLARGDRGRALTLTLTLTLTLALALTLTLTLTITLTLTLTR